MCQKITLHGFLDTLLVLLEGLDLEVYPLDDVADTVAFLLLCGFPSDDSLNGKMVTN